MLIIKNSNGQIFCSPVSGKPYRFETEELAASMIKKFDLQNVFIVDEDAPISEEKELRYGGQDDLW